MSKRTKIVVSVLAVVTCVVTATAARAVIAERDDTARHYLGGSGWPVNGQAAYRLGDGATQTSPKQPMVPIASLAKVMTAYLVLQAFPLQPGSDGFTIGITEQDVSDTAERRSQDQSVVKVAAGERLTERQALEALLLPSANNIAVILARITSGSVNSFVALMNDAAHSLRMQHTIYTDPSGFDAGTRSTASDQLLLARAATAVPAFATLVSMKSATLPVAGTVHNTNTLLGRNGFIGVKTGSDAAAGGCFAFRAIRWIDGKQTTITGVVLGQPGHDRIAAALEAADAMVERIAGLSRRQVQAPPELGQRTLAPGTAPRSH